MPRPSPFPPRYGPLDPAPAADGSQHSACMRSRRVVASRAAGAAAARCRLAMARRSNHEAALRPYPEAAHRKPPPRRSGQRKPLLRGWARAQARRALCGRYDARPVRDARNARSGAAGRRRRYLRGGTQPCQDYPGALARRASRSRGERATSHQEPARRRLFNRCEAARFPRRGCLFRRLPGPLGTRTRARTASLWGCCSDRPTRGAHGTATVRSDVEALACASVRRDELRLTGVVCTGGA